MVFSSAVSAGSNWKDWNTKPSMRPRSSARASSSSAARSCPPSSTAPEDGRSSPAISPSSVDLPEPEAPTMATASPALTENEISCRIASSPSPLGTTLPSAATSITAFVIAIVPPMLKKLVSCLLLAILLALPAKVAMAAEKRILVYGDSLSAGFGIAVRDSWPALLGQRLRQQGSTFASPMPASAARPRRAAVRAWTPR
jgi:acyl-CoA thioesterase-1